MECALEVPFLRTTIGGFVGRGGPDIHPFFGVMWLGTKRFHNPLTFRRQYSLHQHHTDLPTLLKQRVQQGHLREDDQQIKV